MATPTPAGPAVRTDLIDVYIFHLAEGVKPRYLQLLRAPRVSTLLPSTWQPLMGHIEAAETAVDAVIRELREEVGLQCCNASTATSSATNGTPDVLGFWQLEGVHPYFVAAANAIFLSPRFAVEVRPNWRPTLNHEHIDHRWVPSAHIEQSFFWPGQRAAIDEIEREILHPLSLSREALRIRPT